MKHWKKVAAGVLVVLVVVVGLLWWQKENLEAIKKATQYSREELEDQLQQNQQAIKDAVNDAPEVVVRDVTEEEKQALKDGTLSQDELINRLTDDAGQTAVKPSVPESAESTPAASDQQEMSPPTKEENKLNDEAYQKAVSTIVAEVYVLRESYTLELDAMYEAAKAEYRVMPDSEKTTEKLMKWAMGYVSKANQMEKACDATMKDILARLKTLIQENDGDLSLVDTMAYSYANEKSLKKAWYMSKLEKRGLI